MNPRPPRCPRLVSTWRANSVTRRFPVMAQSSGIVLWQASESLIMRAESSARIRAMAGSRCGLCQYREAVILERRFSRRRAQKRQILHRFWLRVHRRRHRVDDRIVRIVGENAYDFHARLDLSIGRIDDTERRFAAGDVSQSSSDIDRHRHLRLDGLPQAKVL